MFLSLSLYLSCSLCFSLSLSVLLLLFLSLSICLAPSVPYISISISLSLSLSLSLSCNYVCFCHFVKLIYVSINYFISIFDWSRTADLWYRKRPLYQLPHHSFILCLTCYVSRSPYLSLFVAALCLFSIFLFLYFRSYVLYQIYLLSHSLLCFTFFHSVLF